MIESNGKEKQSTINNQEETFYTILSLSYNRDSNLHLLHSGKRAHFAENALLASILVASLSYLLMAFRRSEIINFSGSYGEDPFTFHLALVNGTRLYRRDLIKASAPMPV